VIRGWHVVDAPANGQISNVSAFVLPVAWPMADDGGQLPMFGGEDAARDLLMQVIKAQAEGIRTIAAVNHTLMELEKLRLANGTVGSLRGTTTTSRAKRPHQPQTREFREWSGFCAFFQNLERVLRRDHQLGPDADVPKEMFYAAGAPSPKTITRIMVETYGMKADQWPPSTWPADRI